VKVFHETTSSVQIPEPAYCDWISHYQGHKGKPAEMVQVSKRKGQQAAVGETRSVYPSRGSHKILLFIHCFLLVGLCCFIVVSFTLELDYHTPPILLSGSHLGFSCVQFSQTAVNLCSKFCLKLFVIACSSLEQFLVHW